MSLACKWGKELPTQLRLINMLKTRFDVHVHGDLDISTSKVMIFN